MPIVARTRQREYPLHGTGTLMSRCEAAGLPVASACSGRGACGRCLVTLLRGGEVLPPADLHEASVLARLCAAPDQRLSCQCPMPAADAEVLLTTGYW